MFGHGYFGATYFGPTYFGPQLVSDLLGGGAKDRKLGADEIEGLKAIYDKEPELVTEEITEVVTLEPVEKVDVSPIEAIEIELSRVEEVTELLELEPITPLEKALDIGLILAIIESLD